MNEKQWYPLESNPSNLTSYIEKLGFDTLKYHFIDVLSTDDWAISMVSQPVLAVIFLFPMKNNDRGPGNFEPKLSTQNIHPVTSHDVWYVKQRIRNACGTFAILHALANIPECTQAHVFKASMWIERFLERCPSYLSPIEKAEYVESDKEIESMHDTAARDCNNQTSRGDLSDEISTHFVTFVNVNNNLYELDGRRDQGPLLHGNTNDKDFLKDSCNVIQKCIQKDPDELRFSIIALAAKPNVEIC